MTTSPILRPTCHCANEAWRTICETCGARLDGAGSNSSRFRPEYPLIVTVYAWYLTFVAGVFSLLWSLVIRAFDLRAALFAVIAMTLAVGLRLHQNWSRIAIIVWQSISMIQAIPKLLAGDVGALVQFLISCFLLYWFARNRAYFVRTTSAEEQGKTRAKGVKWETTLILLLIFGWLGTVYGAERVRTDQQLQATIRSYFQPTWALQWRSPSERITAIALSSDGKTLVAGGADGSIRIWDVARRQVVGKLEGHSDAVHALALSSDGKTLVSEGEHNATIRIWDMTSRRQIGRVIGHTGVVYALALSDDGKTIVSGGARGFIQIWKTIRLWRWVIGWPVGPLTGHKDRVLAVTLSRDGKTITSTGVDNTVRSWDVASRQQVGIREGDWANRWVVALSHDGKTLASGKWEPTLDGLGRDVSWYTFLWDLTTGQTFKYDFKVPIHSIEAVAFSGDGKTIASVDDLEISVWDIKSGQQITTLVAGHTDEVRAVVLSGDGKTVVSGGGDATIRLWDAATGQPIGLLEGHGKRGSEDKTTGRPLIGGVATLALSADGKTLVSGGESADPTIRIWDMTTRQQVALLQGHTDRIWQVALSADGKTLVSCSDDNTIRLWDITARQQISEFQGHTGIWAIALSPDGKTLVAGGKDGIVRRWDVATRQQIGEFQGHTAVITDVAFSGDGRTVASGSGDNTVRIWDVVSKRQIGIIRGETLNGYLRVALNADGKRVASGAWGPRVSFSIQNLIPPIDDRANQVPDPVRIWDVTTGQAIGTVGRKSRRDPSDIGLGIWGRSPDEVWDIALSADGKTIVVGGYNDVSVWTLLSR